MPSPKMRFSKSDEGRTVYVLVEGEYIEGTISTYVGDCHPNPGRELVEVHSPRFGYEMFDAENVYIEPPKPESPKQPQLVEPPSWAVGWCHYCGMPAKQFGFFDEPVCPECS